MVAGSRFECHCCINVNLHYTQLVVYLEGKILIMFQIEAVYITSPITPVKYRLPLPFLGKINSKNSFLKAVYRGTV